MKAGDILDVEETEPNSEKVTSGTESSSSEMFATIKCSGTEYQIN